MCMAPKITKAGLIKKLDMVFSKKIRERDRRCLRCGQTEMLQCAHLISRTYKALRWNPNNAICLCYRDHIFWAHKNPLEFAEFVREKFPNAYEYVIEEKKKNLPPLSMIDLQDIYDDLAQTTFDPIEEEF